ncbi:E4, partial [Human papillomavirus type 85]
YNVLNLCTVPVTRQYPLLQLLENYNTPPHRIPKPPPCAPKRVGVRRRLENHSDIVDSQKQVKSTDCPWTTSTTPCLVHLQATTGSGSTIVVTLRL